MTYKPLPDNVTIQRSSIHGLGLFTTVDVDRGHNFGISHVSSVRFDNGYIRTPLGGFINHSEDPNCEYQKEESGFPAVFKECGDFLYLKATTDISANTELNTKYFMYNIEDGSITVDE